MLQMPNKQYTEFNFINNIQYAKSLYNIDPNSFRFSLEISSMEHSTPQEFNRNFMPNLYRKVCVLAAKQGTRSRGSFNEQSISTSQTISPNATLMNGTWSNPKSLFGWIDREKRKRDLPKRKDNSWRRIAANQASVWEVRRKSSFFVIVEWDLTLIWLGTKGNRIIPKKHT